MATKQAVITSDFNRFGGAERASSAQKCLSNCKAWAVFQKFKRRIEFAFTTLKPVTTKATSIFCVLSNFYLVLNSLKRLIETVSDYAAVFSQNCRKLGSLLLLATCYSSIMVYQNRGITTGQNGPSNCLTLPLVFNSYWGSVEHTLYWNQRERLVTPPLQPSHPHAGVLMARQSPIKNLYFGIEFGNPTNSLIYLRRAVFFNKPFT
ncbi:hypothetical protein EGR_09434 [Echinococcus granulosus]|uniref:Uncharacterized protein n=1 Tax=Echinococcus granulosus TaxID=6210 RepID=W6U593_ECHGR|nr:hypothetical protein EGR_09434 [Echinococcus granulosus]EUB55721.1 hypothetical protein EGR_09434 [Echinococcus granulosus]